MKNKISLFVAVILIISLLSGCKGENDTTTVTPLPTVPKLEYVSRFITLPGGLERITNITVVNDSIFLLAHFQDGVNVYTMNPDGAELTEALNAPPEMLAILDNADADSVIVDGEGNVFLCVKNGELAFSITVTRPNGAAAAVQSNVPNALIAPFGVLSLADGTAAALVMEGVGGAVLPIEPNSAAYGEGVSVPFVQDGYSGGGRYDFLYSDTVSLYGYVKSSGETETLFDFAGVDIPFASVTSLAVLPDDTIICAASVNGKAQLARLTRQPVVERSKTILTLASFGPLSSTDKEQLAKFNRENKDFSIITKQYNTSVNGSAYGVDQESIDAFNLAIVTGKAPDIVFMLGDFPEHTYTQKGVFEDLYPYLDADIELGGRAAIVPEVLRAFETDDKLYQLSTHFSIETAVANPQILGELNSWTLDDALALLEKYPGAKPYGGLEARSPFEYGLERFVDWETGECSFESGEFLKFLEYAKAYARPGISQTEITELAQSSAVNNFITHQVNKQRYGDELVYVGRYPGAEGSGNLIMPSGLMAISSSCEHKEVAWAFISSLLAEDIQTAGNSHSWMFPTNAAAMKNKAREATEREQRVILYGDTIKMPAMTQADIDAVYALLASIDGRTKNDEKLLAIITEEAQAYFAGAKIAEESARLIQSRATLYVNEQK